LVKGLDCPAAGTPWNHKDPPFPDGPGNLDPSLSGDTPAAADGVRAMASEIGSVLTTIHDASPRKARAA